MPHIHWVARQNKLEIPDDEEEVKTRDKAAALLFGDMGQSMWNCEFAQMVKKD
jgi:hypothetical protein